MELLSFSTPSSCYSPSSLSNLRRSLPTKPYQPIFLRHLIPPPKSAKCSIGSSPQTLGFDFKPTLGFSASSPQTPATTMRGAESDVMGLLLRERIVFLSFIGAHTDRVLNIRYAIRPSSLLFYAGIYLRPNIRKNLSSPMNPGFEGPLKVFVKLPERDESVVLGIAAMDGAEVGEERLGNVEVEEKGLSVNCLMASHKTRNFRYQWRVRRF